MKIFLVTFGITCLGATSLHAQWSNTEWKLNEEKSTYTCYYCTGTQKAYRDQNKWGLEHMEKWVSPELERISRWMSSMSFKEAKVDKTPFPYYTLPLMDRSKAALTVLGERAASFGTYDGIELSYDEFIDDLQEDGTYSDSAVIENSITLAHEVYHGVHMALHPADETKDATWFSESVPEAVGKAWAFEKYGVVQFNPTDYALPLHAPENHYRRDHFFYYLGEMLQSKPTMAYLTELDKESGFDNHDGLMWLNDFLKSKGENIGLASFFPRFIARHAPDQKYFGTTSTGRSLQTKVAPGVPVVTKVDLEPRQIKEVAAIYTKAGARFTGDWSHLADPDRIYVNTLTIDKAERMQEARLIVNSDVVPKNDRYVQPIFAANSDAAKPLHTRVTNLADVPQDSTPQKISLAMETARVEISLPACMEVGQTLPLTINSPLTDEEVARVFGSGPAKLRASAGKIDGNVTNYTAPDKAQTVTFSLNIPTVEGSSKKVVLPPVNVSAKGCMVQLRAGEAVLTYNAAPEFTEFSSPGRSERIYFKADDIAMYNGSWTPIPAQMKAMMLGKMTGNITESIGSGPSGILNEDDEFGIHNMPKIFSERFSWSNLRNTRAMDGSNPKREPAPCPDTSKDCTTITFSMDGHAVPVVFDGSGRPVTVNFAGQIMGFHYGGFNIKRPPGW